MTPKTNSFSGLIYMTANPESKDTILYMMIGLPKSGTIGIAESISKSTNTPIINVGNLYKALTGGVISQETVEMSDHLSFLIASTIGYYMSRDCSVIVEGASLNVKGRKPFIEAAASMGGKVIGMWVTCDPKIRQSRITADPKVQEILESLFEGPTLEEGFETIIGCQDMATDKLMNLKLESAVEKDEPKELQN